MGERDDTRSAFRWPRTTRTGLRLAGLLIFAAIVPSLIGIVLFQVTAARTLHEQRDSVAGLGAEAIEQQVTLLLDGLRTQADLIASRQVLNDQLVAARAKGDYSEAKTVLPGYLGQAISRLEPKKRPLSLVVLDPQGRTIASAGSAPVRDHGLTVSAIRRGGVRAAPDTNAIDAWSPVRDAEGEVIGTVVLRTGANVFQREMFEPTGRLSHAVQGFQRREKGSLIVLTNEKNQVIGGPHSLIGKSIPGLPGSTRTSFSHEVTLLGREWIGSRVNVSGMEWTVFAALPQSGLLAEQQNLVVGITGAWLTWAVFTAIVAFFVSTRFVAPVGEVAEAAGRFRDGSWDERVDAERYRDEPRQLGEAFNSMADHIQKSFEDLRSSEEFARSVIRAHPSGVAVVDASGRVTIANERATGLIGTDSRGALASDALACLPPEAREAIGQDLVYRAQDVPIRCESGITHWCNVSVSPVELSEGQRGTLVVMDEVTELHRHQERLAYLATHDETTGLPNRRMLEDALFSAVSSARRGGQFALILLGMDNFTFVNVTLGAQLGDEFIAEMAVALRSCVRLDESVFRYSGDEFAVLLRDAGVDSALAVAERLRDAGSKVSLEQSQKLTVTLSAGVVPIDATSEPRWLLAAAESALYRAKELGRNRAVVYRGEADGIAPTPETRHMVALLKTAAERNLLELHYQPIFRTADGTVAWHEALVRLHDPETDTLLPPVAFIPIAEQFGLMSGLTRWVLDRAIRVLRDEPATRLSINLSATDVSDPDLPGLVAALLDEHRVGANRLILEVTETTVIQDLERARQQMERMHKLGLTFALDDFGVGYNAFSFLRDLPVDIVKIDGSFISALDEDPAQVRVVETIRALARWYGKETVAESVGSDAAVAALAGIGVDYLQGFLLARPSPVISREPADIGYSVG